MSIDEPTPWDSDITELIPSESETPRRFRYMLPRDVNKFSSRDLVHWWVNFFMMILIVGLLVTFSVMFATTVKRISDAKNAEKLSLNDIATIETTDVGKLAAAISSNITTSSVYISSLASATASELNTERDSVRNITTDCLGVQSDILDLDSQIATQNNRLYHAYLTSQALYSAIHDKQTTNNQLVAQLQSELSQEEYEAQIGGIDALITSTLNTANGEIATTTQKIQSIPTITDAQVQNEIRYAARNAYGNINRLTTLHQMTAPIQVPTTPFVIITLATFTLDPQTPQHTAIMLTARYTNGYTVTVTAGVEVETINGNATPLITLGGTGVSSQFGGLHLLQNGQTFTVAATFGTKGPVRPGTSASPSIADVFMSKTSMDSWTVLMQQQTDPAYLFPATPDQYTRQSYLYQFYKYTDTISAQRSGAIVEMQCLQTPAPFLLPPPASQTTEVGPAQCLYNHASIASSVTCIMGFQQSNTCQCFNTNSLVWSAPYQILPLTACAPFTCIMGIGSACPASQPIGPPEMEGENYVLLQMVLVSP